MPPCVELRLPPMPPRLAASKRRRPAWRLLFFSYALLTAAWAWRLSPPADSPHDEAMALARLERIAAYFGKAPAETVPAILAGVTRLSDAQLRVLDEWLRQPPLDQLRRITTQESADLIGGNRDMRDALLLAWLGQPAVLAPYDAHVMIAAAGDRLDPRVVLHAYEQLARQAAGQGSHAVAASILQRAVELPLAGWDIVQRLLDAASLQGEPAAALRSLASWIKRQESASNPSHDSGLAAARDAEAMLLLQLDRAPEALDKQLRLLDTSGRETPDAATLERALVCARASGELLRLVPWLERALENAAASEPERLRWMRALASISDQELPAATAYAAYARLHEMGDAAALPRLAALAVAAKREDHCEQVLASVLADAEGRALVERLAAARHAPARRALARAQFVTVRAAQKHTPP